jgi:hypothetical protein
MTRQVRSWAIAALAAFALAGAAAPSFAAIVYDVTNATSVQNGYSLSGYIEVSGTGTISNLSSFSLTATKADNPTLTFVSGNGGVVVFGLIATDSALYVPDGSTLQITETGRYIDWANNDSGSTVYRGGSGFGLDPAWNSGSYPNTGVNGWQIGTAQAVPEPSTYCMALAGLACGGYTMFRRRRAR